jgi:uncharacterized protein (DUF1697 family)
MASGTITRMQYVALLRGINVGGRTIKMADLKLCFEKLGFQDVATALQTGNVIFTSDKSAAALKSTIEAGLTKTFDYPAFVLIVSLDSLRTIIESYPFADPDPEHHDYVVFFEDGLEKQLVDDATIDKAIEKVQAGAGVVYWRVAKGSTLKSSFARYLAKAPYKNAHTNRNIRTLEKVIRAMAL